MRKSKLPLKKLYTLVSHFLKRVGPNRQAKKKKRRPQKNKDALNITLWQEKHPLPVLFFGTFIYLPHTTFG